MEGLLQSAVALKPGAQEEKSKLVVEPNVQHANDLTLSTGRVCGVESRCSTDASGSGHVTLAACASEAQTSNSCHAGDHLKQSSVSAMRLLASKPTSIQDPNCSRPSIPKIVEEDHDLALHHGSPCPEVHRCLRPHNGSAAHVLTSSLDVRSEFSRQRSPTPDGNTLFLDAASTPWMSNETGDLEHQTPVDRVTWQASSIPHDVPQPPECPTSVNGATAEKVEFSRVCIDGPPGLGPTDIDESSAILLEALVLRMDYMARSCQPFCTTTAHALSASKRGPSPAAGNGRGRAPSASSSRSASPPPPAPRAPKFEDVVVPDVNHRTRCGHPVMRDGILYMEDPETKKEMVHLNQPLWSEFLEDFNVLLALSVHGPVKSFSFRRLSYLGLRFEMHTLLNEGREIAAAKKCPHRDFYNVRKVDTHVHAASCMNHKHLLRFMKKKARTEQEMLVCQDSDGHPMSLGDVFRSLNLTPHHLSVDMLDVHADRNTFHRFDKFNLKYNPFGQSRLREIFLKSDNYVQGKFFAQLLHEVIDDLEESKYQMAEPRLSIYGRSRSEWSKLSKWAVDNSMASSNIRWLIQVPRLYNVYKAKGQVQNFQDVLNNIFQPLFEATLEPAKHPEIFRFMTEVAGFDSVDDESKPETAYLTKDTPTPENWDTDMNPPYAYYLFYMYANITALNNLRKSLGYSTFTLRPHCGEAGPVHHLAAAFLLADNISHGLLLRKVPALQYLYYLAQIGVAMSPLSNNSLFLDYHRSPLPEFRARGLRISVSTDDPLMFHFTKEPLIEEYSIAAQVWKLGSADMAELARNSVLMSDFSHSVKQHWLGSHYDKEGVDGNDIRCTNLPDVRVAYRHETLLEELVNLRAGMEDVDATVTPKARYSRESSRTK